MTRSSGSGRCPNIVLRVSRSLFATLTVAEVGRTKGSLAEGVMAKLESGGSGGSGEGRRGGRENR